jgi:hypothetical protein
MQKERSIGKRKPVTNNFDSGRVVDISCETKKVSVSEGQISLKNKVDRSYMMADILRRVNARSTSKRGRSGWDIEPPDSPVTVLAPSTILDCFIIGGYVGFP